MSKHAHIDHFSPKKWDGVWQSPTKLSLLAWWMDRRLAAKRKSGK
jgi:hypothetical protein